MLSANLPSNCDRASNLFLFYLLPSPTDFSITKRPNKDSMKTPMAIPTAVNMDTIVIFPVL